MSNVANASIPNVARDEGMVNIIYQPSLYCISQKFTSYTLPTSLAFSCGTCNSTLSFRNAPTSPPCSFTYPLFNSSSVVYDAYPIDDPDESAYQGAIVLQAGTLAISTSEDIPSSSASTDKGTSSTEDCLLFACCYRGCGFSCQSAKDMREHFRNHPGKHEYRCTYPGCTFTSTILKDMNYHRGFHSGERPFLCSYPKCGFAAPNHSQLRLHMVSHSEDKPYKCSFGDCSYVTRYKSALINHERTHTGEKPYRCKYCKTFSAKQKSGLQYHIKTVHLSK